MAGKTLLFILEYLKIMLQKPIFLWLPEVEIFIKYKQPKVNLYHEQLVLKVAQVSDVNKFTCLLNYVA